MEKINQLAVTLKKNGLASTMSEAVEKAKEIILGVNKEKDNEDFEKEIEQVEEDIESISKEHIDEASQNELVQDEETEEFVEAPEQISEVQQSLDEKEEPTMTNELDPSLESPESTTSEKDAMELGSVSEEQHVEPIQEEVKDEPENLANTESVEAEPKENPVLSNVEDYNILEDDRPLNQSIDGPTSEEDAPVENINTENLGETKVDDAVSPTPEESQEEPETPAQDTPVDIPLAQDEVKEEESSETKDEKEEKEKPDLHKFFNVNSK